MIQKSLDLFDSISKKIHNVAEWIGSNNTHKNTVCPVCGNEIDDSIIPYCYAFNPPRRVHEECLPWAE